MSLLTKPGVIILSTVGAVVGGTVVVKDLLGGREYRGAANLDGKTFLVTGANSGIGKEIVRELSKRKARIIMACRDLEKCEKAREEFVIEHKNKYVYCRYCDLASIQSVKKFADKINNDFDRIDVLINNAGVMQCPRNLTKEGIEFQFGVNYLGHFLLTNLLLDKLKESSPSRIINLVGTAHLKGVINFEDLNSDSSYDPAKAYYQSKLALMLFSQELSRRLKGSRVTVNASHPGFSNTDITRHLSYKKNPVALMFSRPVLWFFLKTPRQGAQSVLYLALDESLRGVTGKYFSVKKEQKLASHISDENVARRLWETSVVWSRLDHFLSLKGS